MNRAEIVAAAIAIANEYKAQKLVLTLRQMYYQFVARGLLPNGQKVYKRIGAALTEARYDGRFPIEMLEDRGRSVDSGNFTRNDVDSIAATKTAAVWLPQLPELMLRRARWYGQENHVSVWVEKEALAGVFEPTCQTLGVSWFACKGYPSVSALAEWLGQSQLACGGRADFWYRYGPLRLDSEHEGTAKRCVVLYFGDHDPDGWEIPRSAERNLAKLRRLSKFRSNYPIEFRRIALNMNQIEQYGPPPFEAKITSARYQSYLDEHETDEAWELDALEPTVLRDLITSNVDSLFDQSIADENERYLQDVREDMRNEMREPDWAPRALSPEDYDDEDSGDWEE